MSRSLVTVLLLLAALSALDAQTGPADLEEASDFARNAARAALNGPARVFVEALDTDGILEHRLGATDWNGLAERQRNLLRSVVGDQFLQSLSSAPGSTGEIGWSWATPKGSDGVEVMLGLKFGERALKTRWSVRRRSNGWRVSDVVLCDPGISLAEMSVRSLGAEPVRRRSRRREAERTAFPRLVALGVIAVLVVIAAPRVPRGKRTLLFLTAAAPAFLFAIDGVLAVRRTLAEEYALASTPGRPSWREAEQAALASQREGRTADARRSWARAIAQGAPAGPIDYQMGLDARKRGNNGVARGDFQRALAEKSPAPGAAKELAAMDAAQGKNAQAQDELKRYLDLSGPDPDALSMLAVIQTNLGESAQAVATVERARSLLGDPSRASELEAQVRARAGDAAGAVAALRPLEATGRLDRAALRNDPAYLSIANDPAWVAFLNEKPEKK